MPFSSQHRPDPNPPPNMSQTDNSPTPTTAASFLQHFSSRVSLASSQDKKSSKPYKRNSSCSPSSSAYSSHSSPPPPPSDLTSPAPVTPNFHLSCILLHHCKLFSSVYSLIFAAKLSDPLSCTVGGHATLESIRAHSEQTLTLLVPHLIHLPYPLRLTLSSFLPLTTISPTVFPFPIPCGTLWTPPIGPCLPPPKTPPGPLQSHRSNLEISWDLTLQLHRRFTKSTPYPASAFDFLASSRILVSLHPANADIFAARFVNLASKATVCPKAKKRKDNDKDHNRKNSCGVTLGRTPSPIRSMFEPHELFFLDFLSGADSANLNVALMYRLAAGIRTSLEKASGATTNVSFVETVAEARMFGKLLTVILCQGNWSSFSTRNEDSEVEGKAWGKKETIWKRAIIENLWRTIMDIEELLKSAIISGGILEVLAVLLVTDVFVRMGKFDPVLSGGEWFERLVEFLRTIDIQASGPGPVPVVDFILEEMVEREGGGEKIHLMQTEEECAGVGNDRFVAECCHGMRRLCQMVSDGKAVPRPSGSSQKISTPTTSHTSKTPSKIDAEKQMQEDLKEEFGKRLDGRLRELIGVVALSRPRDRKGARETYETVAQILYPNMAKTVIYAASHICADRAEEMDPPVVQVQREKQRKRVDTKKSQAAKKRQKKRGESKQSELKRSEDEESIQKSIEKLSQVSIESESADVQGYHRR